MIRPKYGLWLRCGTALLIIATQSLMLFNGHPDSSLRWMNWTLLVLGVAVLVGSLFSIRYRKV